MESIKEMEQNSFVSFFHTKTIRQKFISGNYSLRELLKTIVGKERYFVNTCLIKQFSHHGWSGFISAVEDHPETLLDRKQITLKELLQFELLLELDALHHVLGNNWKTIGLIMLLNHRLIYLQICLKLNWQKLLNYGRMLLNGVTTIRIKRNQLV